MRPEEAIKILWITAAEELEDAALNARYEERSGQTDSKIAQKEIHTAYAVLQAYRESPLLKAKMRFGYGLDEIPERAQLKDRYEKLSSETDSKTIQKQIDEAYEVLLAIAA